MTRSRILMTRIRIPPTVAGISACILSMYPPASAQEAASGSMVLVQPYETYGFTDKMLLSGAYFVNPSLIKQTQTGRFVPASDLNQEEAQLVEELVRDGQANFSIQSGDDTYYKLVESDLSWLQDEEVERFGVIVDAKEGLLAAKGVPVISWGQVEASSKEKVRQSVGASPGS